MLLWPCRIVTPEATYDPAHLRVEPGDKAEIIAKDGTVIAQITNPLTDLVADGRDATGQVHIVQRWQVVGDDGAWLVELTDGCGCGGTRTTGTNPIELAWAMA